MPIEDVIWHTSTDFVSGAEVLAEECACDFDALDAGVQAKAAEAATEASEVLYVLSARTMRGTTTSQVRVKRLGECASSPGRPEEPANDFRGVCPASIITLKWPVRSITEVKIGSTVVDPAEYQVIDAMQLVRVRDADGNHVHWPSVSQFDAADEEPGALEVTYEWGIEPPTWVKDAALELACLYLKRKMGKTPTIDQNISSVSRQGISFNVKREANTLVRHGSLDTMPAVERFMSITNPRGYEFAPTAWSPDIPRGVEIS